jgi:hypothetical protein
VQAVLAKSSSRLRALPPQHHQIPALTERVAVSALMKAWATIPINNLHDAASPAAPTCPQGGRRGYKQRALQVDGMMYSVMRMCSTAPKRVHSAWDRPVPRVTLVTLAMCV